mgnify:CR=1 FL=1
MEALFKKLNYKQHNPVMIVNAPVEFQEAQDWLSKKARVLNDPKNFEKTDFSLLFATKQSEIDHWAPLLDENLEGDAIFWCCYPKGSSKKYKCDFNRDTGWEIFGKLNYEPVRQVAIDDDWSALRFRRVDYIKTLTRSKDFALTDAAKNRTSGK